MLSRQIRIFVRLAIWKARGLQLLHDLRIKNSRGARFAEKSVVGQGIDVAAPTRTLQFSLCLQIAM